MEARLATPARWSRVCILAARLALHKGSAAGSWSGVAKSMCSVMLHRSSERSQKMKVKTLVLHASDQNDKHTTCGLLSFPTELSL